jgi:hypothetical protein
MPPTKNPAKDAVDLAVKRPAPWAKSASVKMAMKPVAKTPTAKPRAAAPRAGGAIQQTVARGPAFGVPAVIGHLAASGELARAIQPMTAIRPVRTSVSP